jgi:uncharacterized membrane protein
VAALAYLLLPISGLIAYLKGTSPRLRFHGLQAIVFGALWAVVLYAATWTTPVVTQVVFAAGLVLWIVLIAGAALGRDIELPIAGDALRSAAEFPPGSDSQSKLV